MKNKIIVGCFALLLAILTIGNILLPKREFSDNENRFLAAFPQLSWDSLKSGKFTKKFAEYTADHFPLRDSLVSLKARSELALLRRENNGVFKGSDGYLLDSFDTELCHGFYENLEYLASFEKRLKADYQIESKTIIAPTAAAVLSEKLPPFAVTADTLELLTAAETQLEGFVNAYPALREHKDSYIYYRTDHHWTSEGAYYAYCEYAKACGLVPREYNSLEIEALSHEFFGTTYSRFGLFNGKNADTLSAPSGSALGELRVDNGKELTDSIYHPEKLKEKDKYQYFLGGNDPLVRVDTQIQNNKTLLLIKDSYANSLLPYLLLDYQTIILVDLRYYVEAVTDLIKSSGVTDVLVVYNAKSFASEKSIRLLSLQ